MKKLLSYLLFIGALCFMLQVDVDASTFKEVRVVNNSSLVAKANPTMQAYTNFTVKRGEFVTILDTTNGWAKIDYNGKLGYVNASYLKTANATIKMASSKSGLVVKQSPSKVAKTVAILKYNMIMEDFGSVGAGWSFVQYGNVTGYVATSFMSTPKATTMYVKQSGSVRNIASTSGQALSTVNPEAKVQAYTTLYGWTYISIGKTRGYIEAAKLTTTLTKQQVTTGLMPNCSQYDIFLFEYESPNDYQYYHDLCFYEEGVPSIGDPDMFYESYYKEGNTLIIANSISAPLYIQFPLKVGKTWTSPLNDFETMTYRVVSLNETMKIGNKTIENVVKIQIANGYYYFADGYGIVRAPRDGGESTITLLDAY